MKKFIVFALCAISTLSVFAEAYSKATADSIKEWKKKCEYSYNAQVSSQSDSLHFVQCVRHSQNIKGTYLTKEQINVYIEKFKNVKIKQSVLGLVYAWNGHVEQAIQFNKKVNSGLIAINVFNAYLIRKDKVKAWEFAKNTLINDGSGMANTFYATDILNKMFRHRPASVTKQQQIEVLKQLSEIYPIPGTDFNKWKGFMGFVGFKYKQLTGKELF